MSKSKPPRVPQPRTPRKSAKAAWPTSQPADVLAGQASHQHRAGVYFASTLVNGAAKAIDGVALQAALAARGWSAIALTGSPRRPSRQPEALDAVWLISAKLSQAALEAAVTLALASQDEDEELDDWLEAFTRSGQGAAFELEHFKSWTAEQWFNHEFGDDDGDDDDDDDDEDLDDDDDDDDADEASGDTPVNRPASTSQGSPAAAAFAQFPPSLRDALKHTRQVYAVRSEQASEPGAAWHATLVSACEVLVASLGKLTSSVELFETEKRRWGYRVW
ncbi:hypothetical protein AACH06_19765 [Ideonella sp. DXS29W]|uniref:Uncharacterized protein n=1 Tax=Ideonella lacteola TaxID=2984193 RepID=A0ABU9BSX1_9BURK